MNIDNLKFSKGSYYYNNAINQPGLLAEDIVTYFLHKSGFPLLNNKCFPSTPLNGQVLSYNAVTERIEFTNAANTGYESLITLINTKQDKLQIQKEGVNVGLTGDITKLNFTGSNISVSNSGNTANISVIGGGTGISLNDVQYSFKYVQLTPVAINSIPNLSDLPIDYNEVVIAVNGIRVSQGITVNSLGIFNVNSSLLGYSIDTGDIITAIYFS